MRLEEEPRLPNLPRYIHTHTCIHGELKGSRESTKIDSPLLIEYTISPC